MVDILLGGRLIWVLSNLYFDRLLTRSLTLWTYLRHQSVEVPGVRNFERWESEITIWTRIREVKRLILAAFLPKAGLALR